MQPELRDEYARIGRERDDAGRLHERERFWFWVRVAAGCWAWVVIGGAIMAQAFHMNATVGAFFYPDVMDRAQLFLQAGVFVGTAGAAGTLLWGWRAAMKRGYLD